MPMECSEAEMAFQNFPNCEQGRSSALYGLCQPIIAYRLLHKILLNHMKLTDKIYYFMVIEIRREFLTGGSIDWKKRLSMFHGCLYYSVNQSAFWLYGYMLPLSIH